MPCHDTTNLTVEIYFVDFDVLFRPSIELCCFYIMFSIISGRGKAAAAIDAARSRTSTLTAQRKDEDAAAANRPNYVHRTHSIIEKSTTEAAEKQKMDKDGIFTTPTPTLGEESTWLDRAVAEVSYQKNAQSANI